MFNQVLKIVKKLLDSYNDKVDKNKKIILPDFVLPSRVNQRWAYSGIDYNYKDNNYPHPISYQYNDRGFRDQPWPTDLTNSTWCLGDSFTVGIGAPIEHTWPHLLGNTINVSMDGASNQWIARKAIRVLEEIKPKLMIIQWSFITRGESPDSSLSDEDRRLHFYNLDLTTAELLNNFVALVDRVEQVKQTTRIIHSFIPNWVFGEYSVQAEWDKLRGPNWPVVPKELLNPFIEQELIKFGQDGFFKTYIKLLNSIEYVPELVKLDLARDNFHYGKITAQAFVANIIKLISAPG